ncbi:MAG TPA: hypothetical protein PKG95_03960 [Anaerolineaceae bacterium]|nr:hypothetical protein [Anaerolineaceae bacterium]
MTPIYWQPEIQLLKDWQRKSDVLLSGVAYLLNQYCDGVAARLHLCRRSMQKSPTTHPFGFSKWMGTCPGGPA